MCQGVKFWWCPDSRGTPPKYQRPQAKIKGVCIECADVFLELIKTPDMSQGRNIPAGLLPDKETPYVVQSRYLN